MKTILSRLFILFGVLGFSVNSYSDDPDALQLMKSRVKYTELSPKLTNRIYDAIMETYFFKNNKWISKENHSIKLDEASWKFIVVKSRSVNGIELTKTILALVSFKFETTGIMGLDGPLLTTIVRAISVTITGNDDEPVITLGKVIDVKQGS